jgi:hypothetical protein
VAHIRQELRFVLACEREGAALLLDLAEQPGILDCEYGLGRKGLRQMDHAIGKFANRLL